MKFASALIASLLTACVNGRSSSTGRDYETIFTDYNEVNTELSCGWDSQCNAADIKIRKDGDDGNISPCCAAFPILQPNLETQNLYYCYDLNTLRANRGPYTAAYCADAMLGYMASGAALAAILSLTLL